MKWLAYATCFTFLCACSGSESGDAPKDAGLPEATAVGDCIPSETATGNSKNVGAYCTPGGAQCVQYGNGHATICAIDVDPAGDQFCILIGCKSNDACGELACCTGRVDNPIKACVPIRCVTDADTCPPIPGLEDAGTDDAGMNDAGTDGAAP